MQNKIDYYLHKTYTPDYYHRQFENDLIEDRENHSYLEVSKRITLIVVPFLSLYRPFGTAISLTMGTTRILSTSVSVLYADNLYTGSCRVVQVGLAGVALAGTIYHFTIGLYLTTTADLLTNLARIVQRLYQCEYTKAGEELLQALSSTLYLAIIMTGSLEIVLGSLLMQALVSFIQAREEWREGRMPEAMAKTLMGMIRVYQADQQIILIQRRNILFKQYEDLAKRIYNGRKIDHLYDHPLVQGATQNKAILTDAEGREYDFGAHHFGYGKQAVKGMNVTFHEKEGQTRLEFKITHVFRERLQKIIDHLEENSADDIQEFLKLLGSRVNGIEIGKKSAELFPGSGKDPLMRIYEIHLKGLGKIEIGANENMVAFYDKVTVTMEKGKNLYQFHEALAFLQLDDALRQSAAEDIERMKMGYLFHMACPKEATPFEHSDDYFDLSLEQFKQAIVQQAPEMEEVFSIWLEKMELREILPGRMRFAVDGIADELKKQGAYGVTAALTGIWDEEEIYRRVASILKMGMISHELRDHAKMNQNGLSWGADYISGGSDSVFTQIVTDKNREFREYGYWSPIRFLIAPEILETGTYQYHNDYFGNRHANQKDFWWNGTYLQRDNIFDFLRIQKKYFQPDNEIMIKERISPEYIRGIVVADEIIKEELIRYLKQKDIIQIDEAGRETIFSRPIDEFFHVGSKITKNLFD